MWTAASRRAGLGRFRSRLFVGRAQMGRGLTLGKLEKFREHAGASDEAVEPKNPLEAGRGHCSRRWSD